MIEGFEELIVWQKSHQLTLKTYKLTKDFPKEELYGLVSQMRRAAVSIPSNISEGFRRRSAKDSVHFYVMAQGSLEELRYQLLLSRDLGYIAEIEYNKNKELTDECGKLLNGWIKSQSNTNC